MAGELILIVEDNERNRKLVRDVLRFKGYRTIEVETGEESLRLARDRRPSLILMDIRLPGIDGIAALRRLRADPATQGIPVMAMTASIMTAGPEEMRAAGFDGYQSKPLQVKDFVAIRAAERAPGHDCRPVPLRKEDSVIETGRIVSVGATPASLNIDLAKTAVLVIDMQNDFGSKGGMFDRAGIDLSVIERAVGPTAQVIASARAVGVPIIYIKEGHRPDLSDIGPVGSPYWRMCQRLAVGTEVLAPDGRPSRIHVEDTWNTEILPELAPLASDIIIKKRRWSAFYDTELDAQLRSLGTQYIIVTGCTTSMCIESTIRDAAFRDYICVLPADCTGQPARHDSTYSGHEASLKIIEMSFGWVSNSENIRRALEGSGS